MFLAICVNQSEIRKAHLSSLPENRKERLQLKEEYMRRAIELARKGYGWTNPNPLVGAVIVKDGRIIGEGYHERYGGLHAERNALASCRESPKGATVYVTLEPCCHTGKTPPCTEVLIGQGVKKVVTGSDDPNPLVAGKGIRILREHGIEVVTGFLKEECDALNPKFFSYIRNKMPYVTMKYAMTMDGKIATHTGASKWITGEAARQRVQSERHGNMGIMVGVGTVLADDPHLNCRMEGGKNPIRIICDTNLRMPENACVVTTAASQRTIIATCCADAKRRDAYLAAGCEILEVGRTMEGINLQELMQKLGAQGIDSILLEGGAELNWSMLKAGLVQKVQTYIAPKIFGSQDAKGPVGGGGVALPPDAFALKNTKVEQVGEDFLIESEVVPCLRES